VKRRRNVMVLCTPRFAESAARFWVEFGMILCRREK
jgi:hypothetical protein